MREDYRYQVGKQSHRCYDSEIGLYPLASGIQVSITSDS